MIRILGDMPKGVLGLEAVDDADEDDYEDSLVPAVENAKIFSILWPGQARAFPLTDLEAAKRWAADGEV